MRNIGKTITVILISFLILTTCGDGGKENVEIGGPDTNVNPEASVACPTREKLTGRWEQSLLQDVSGRRDSIRVEFGYYGEFMMEFALRSEGEATRWHAYQGGYTIISPEILSLRYRIGITSDGDDGQPEFKIKETNAKFSISGNGLKLEIPGEPIHELEGPLPFVSDEDEGTYNDDFFVGGHGRFRRDGLCERSEWIDPPWNLNGHCVQDEIRGVWETVFPKTAGPYSLDSVFFDPADSEDETENTFRWKVVRFFDFASSEFATIETMTGGQEDDEPAATSLSSGDDEDTLVPRSRSFEITGTYQWVNAETIEMTVQDDPQGLYPAGTKLKFGVRYDPETLTLVLLNSTGTKITLGRVDS